MSGTYRVCLLVTLGLIFSTSACSKTMCESSDAPIEESHKKYVVDGGHACEPSNQEEGGKRQNVSYKMSVTELERKYEEKFKKLGKVECPPSLYGERCYRDGLNVLAVEFYTGDGSEDRSSGSDAVIGLTVKTQTLEAIAARCAEAQKNMAGATDFAGAMSTLIARCGEGCDAKDETSCGHLDKGLGAVCGVNKDICKQLCETLTGEAAKSRACKLSSM